MRRKIRKQLHVFFQCSDIACRVIRCWIAAVPERPQIRIVLCVSYSVCTFHIYVIACHRAMISELVEKDVCIVRLKLGMPDCGSTVRNVAEIPNRRSQIVLQQSICVDLPGEITDFSFRL